MDTLSWLFWGDNGFHAQHDGVSDARVSEIVVYPIKSCAGISVQQSDFGETGLRLDRHWMIIEADTLTMCTARGIPHMLLIETDLDFVASTLRIIVPERNGAPSSTHTLPFEASADAELIQVKVHSNPTDGWLVADADAPLSKALSAFIGRDVMVVRKGEDVRVAGPKHFWERVTIYDWSYETPNTAYADAFPFLVGTTASLEDLRRRIANSDDPKVVAAVASTHHGKLAMRRFRPNIVVEGGLSAWEEDSWHEVRIGGNRFHVVLRCTRCPMPNVDPQTGISTPAMPNNTLATYRKVMPMRPGQTCFGVNAVSVESKGSVRVGDSVSIVSRFAVKKGGNFLRPEDEVDWQQ